MNAEKRIRDEARALLSKGNWSSSLAVFFILFAGVLLALFVQSFLVLGANVAFSPVFETFSGFIKEFSLENEESFGSSLLMIISSTFGYVGYALGFLFIFPLYCGVKRYFYLLTKGEDAGINEVFYYLTKGLKKCTLLGLRYGLLCVVKFLPCIAPAYFLVVAMISNDFSTAVNSLITLAAFALGIAGLALWILWTSRQSLTIYLFIEDDTKPVGFYVKESERILNTALNTSVRKLMYSFGGWFLLALTGVGMLYFIPYFEASFATSAKWIIKLDKEVY